MDGGKLLSFSEQGNNIDLNLDKELQDSVQVVEQVVNGGYVREQDEVDRMEQVEMAGRLGEDFSVDAVVPTAIG